MALGIGLLIGFERERSKEKARRADLPASDNFALASLFGAVAFELGGVVLLAVAMAGVTALTLVSRASGRRPIRG